MQDNTLKTLYCAKLQDSGGKGYITSAEVNYLFYIHT